MSALKGHPRYGGRRKGTPNKATAATREALQKAFDDLGGVPALVKWGKANPDEFYRLWGRLIPGEIRLADPDGNRLAGFSINVRPPDAEGAEIRAPAPMRVRIFRSDEGIPR